MSSPIDLILLITPVRVACSKIRFMSSLPTLSNNVMNLLASITISERSLPDNTLSSEILRKVS